MKLEGLLKLLPLVNSHYGGQTDSGWVICACPFAPWTHAGGKDGSPSFGFRINDTGPSGYNCFSCNESGKTLDEFINELSVRAVQGMQYNLREANKVIRDEAYEVLDFSSVGEYSSSVLSEEDVVFPEEWLEAFPHSWTQPAAALYLNGRGIRPITVKRLDVRYDTWCKRIVMPIRNRYGELCGCVGRAIEDHAFLKHYNYGGIKKGKEKAIRNPNVLMNEHGVDYNKPIILVEGMFDLMKVHYVYQNVVAFAGVGIKGKRLGRLSSAVELYTYFDKGTGGDSARRLVKKRFKHELVADFIPDIGYKDVGDMPYERIENDLKGVVI